MKGFFALLLAICLLLTGCGSWMQGNYVSITPHRSESDDDGQDLQWIDSQQQLYEAVHYMVTNGISEEVFFIRDYDEDDLLGDMAQVQYQMMTKDPVGAYAVEKIRHKTGINGSLLTLAIEISYRHSRADILRIKTVQGITGAKNNVIAAVEQMKTELVLYVEKYEDIDFAQVVEDYAMNRPEVVMEIPQVSVSVYPDTGEVRVVELFFTYQTNRDSLRNMQSQVELIFESAKLYVSGDESEGETFAHLYGFLMGLNDYQNQTSITPAYSLLLHGVGDAKAFASVYAAMCRQVGLECLMVSGTRNGEAWFWNIVKDADRYFHVDVVRSAQSGAFRQWTDEEMDGYVWDYSAYPVCEDWAKVTEQPEETTTAATEEAVGTTEPPPSLNTETTGPEDPGEE